MSLRRKTLLIVVSTIAGLLGVLYLASRQALLRSFEDLEAQEIRLDVERGKSALSDDLATLDRIARDYAGWDRTYAFMAGGERDYVQSELTDEMFLGNRLAFIVIADVSARPVVSKGFDLQARSSSALPPGLLERLVSPSPLLDLREDEEGPAGLLRLGDGLFLVASRAILTSKGRGPSRGVLIAGRPFDAAEIQHLVEVTHLTLTFHSPSDPLAPRDVRRAVGSLSGAAPVLVRPLEADTIAGYTMVPGLEGQPALVLRVAEPRKIYAQGKATVSYLFASLLTIGLVFGMVALVLLERIVLAPLMRLSEGVARVGRSGDLKSRVEPGGSDEIARLAEAINGMLTALEAAQRERQVSEERFRILAENVPGVIYLCRNDEKRSMQYLSDAVEAVTGYSRADFLSGRLNLPDLYHPDDAARIRFEVDRRLSAQQPFHGVYRLKTAAGEWRWAEEWGSGVFDAKGQVLFLQGFISDITERRAAEEVFKNRERQQAGVARLGWAALAGIGRDALLSEAVDLVAETLGVEHTAVFELLPEEHRLLLRAGFGWQPDLVGKVSIDAGPETQAGFTLATHGPVAVEDLRTDARFVWPSLFRAHDVASGASVIIEGLERPFGVLGAFAQRPHRFAEDDLHFLEAAANVIAAASASDEAREHLQRAEARYRHLVDSVQAIVFRMEPETLRFAFVSHAAEKLLGHEAARWTGEAGFFAAQLSAEDRARVPALLAAAARDRRDLDIEFRMLSADGRVVWLQAFVRALVEDDQLRELVGVMVDVSDRKRQELTARAPARGPATA